MNPLATRSRASLHLSCAAALILLRFVAGAVLPLSADEAYYWLWSKHLAAGYYDHPPAIAYLIRAGTTLFGNTSFGVRLMPLALSAVASWFVWRAGAVLAGDEGVAARACLLFNLTLMAAVETMAATPDAPLIAASAGFLWALVKLDQTGDGRWWLAVGAAGGLALLSKYTAFFLGAGAMAWLVFAAQGRRWLLSPWPYVGAVLSLLIFAPNLWWNGTHHWMTFAFQFGRVGAGHFTMRFLLELLGAQLLLATPFILVAAVLGLSRSTLLTAMALPAILYFAFHSLHDRVQGNWPCFLYPALAVAAAGFIRRDLTGWEAWTGRLAAPIAAAVLFVCYAQAFFAVAPLGRRDPVSRLLAFGVLDVVRQVEETHPSAVLTTDYATTAWFAFYGHLPVVQVNEEQRWLSAPSVEARMGTFVYVAERERDRHDIFASAVPLAPVSRERSGAEIALYHRYVISGAPAGRAP